MRYLLLLASLSACLPDFAVTTEVTEGFDLDNDGVPAPEDCDDTDPTVSPDAVEICDGVRTDCDTLVEQFEASEVDIDGDGYVGCAQWDGDSAQPIGDCAAEDPDVNPEAVEAPGDGIDSNCDDKEICFLDEDDDGFHATLEADPAEDLDCSAPGHALASAGGDCNDHNGGVFPGASELPGDNLDSDCDGEDLCYRDADTDDYRSEDTVPTTDIGCTAEDLALETAIVDCDDGDEEEHYPVVWYADEDGDGYGDPNIYTGSCRAHPTDVDNPDDCDDGDPDINPDTVWYRDGDGDGYGNAADSLKRCTQKNGYVSDSTDCDDDEILFYPGVDVYLDCDGDGAFALDGQDACDWAAGLFCEGWPNADYSPGIFWVPIDCVDDDPDLTDNRFVDCDADGWYDERTNPLCVTLKCDDGTEAPGTWSEPAQVGDCDDEDPDEHNGVTWYPDGDGDTYGDEDAAGNECKRVAATDVTDHTDCDDSQDAINPQTVWYLDCDDDGVYSGEAIVSCAFPGDGNCLTTDAVHDVPASPDCSDEDGTVGSEGYDWYPDCDGDDSVSGTPVLSCEAPVSELVCDGGTTTTSDWTAEAEGPYDCNDDDKWEGVPRPVYLNCDGDDWWNVDPVPDYCNGMDLSGHCGSGMEPLGTTTDPPAGADDCDDDDPEVNPGAHSWPDCDGDGFQNPDDDGISACDVYEELPCDGGSPLDWLHEPTDPDCDDFKEDVTPEDGCGLSGTIDVEEWLADPAANGLGVYSHGSGGSGFPSALAVAPDLNGDGFDDLMFGAGDADMAGVPGSGFAAIVLGRPREEMVGSEPALEGNADWRTGGAVVGDHVGTFVLGLGDAVGDALGDFAVAADDFDGGGTTVGMVFVYAGTEDFASSPPVTVARLRGQVENGHLGVSLAAPDADGDGTPDLLVGSMTLNKAFLFHGPLDQHPGLLSGDLSVDDADLLLSGFQQAGRAVASAGDVDGDGSDDLLVADLVNEPESPAGAVALFTGYEYGTPANLGLFEDSTLVVEGDDPADELGTSVAGIGDLDNDGYDEFVVGAPGANVGKGYAVVVFGSEDYAGEEHTASDHLVLHGSNAAGTAVALAGDTNLDGRTEFLVGGGAGDSQVYVVSLDGPHVGTKYLDTDEDIRIGTLEGATATEFGSVLAGNGDVDADGAPDVLVGAPIRVDQGSPGEAYLIFGGVP